MAINPTMEKKLVVAQKLLGITQKIWLPNFWWPTWIMKKI
jgi:hypothetical protein